jgi:diguanylate cyclase (GGDEF)-like protein
MDNKNKAENELEISDPQLKTHLYQLEQLNLQYQILNEMGNFLQSCLLATDVYAVVGQYASKLFSGQTGRLYALNILKNQLEEVATWGNAATIETLFKPEDCWALRLHRLHIVKGKENRLDCQHFKSVKGENKTVAYLCAPLISQGETLGVLHQRLDETQVVENLEQLVLSLSERISLALTNLKLKESLKLQSIRDPQTNLFSRCYMEETLERELLRATRHRQPLGIIMIDIDKFKSIMDELGGEAGDALLKEMGTYLQSNVRGEDVACRFGTSEFIVLFPEVSLGGTRKRAEQICQNAKTIKIRHQNKIIHPLTISIGVASFPVHATHAVELLRAVEAGLNQAIMAGRDRVEVVRNVE